MKTTEPVLIHAGPLVALLNERDGRREICSLQANQIVGPVFTSWPVVTEAAWLLRHQSDGLPSLLRMLLEQDIHCVHLELAAISWIADYARQYQDLKPQLADLSLVYLSERLGAQHIFTLDRRDFAVYRSSTGKPFLLLPESLSD